MNKPHTVRAENAATIWQWFQERGGLAVWGSVNLSNPGVSWTTPAKNKDGTPTSPPNWQASKRPRIITDPAEVVVSFDREVKRFRVAVRQSSNGLMLKVTNTGTRRIREGVARAGEGAYHTFDYAKQQVVIMAPERTAPLVDWVSSEA